MSLIDCQRIDENMILPDRESLMTTALLVVGILCLLKISHANA
jgi:hypothetical protein